MVSVFLSKYSQIDLNVNYDKENKIRPQSVRLLNDDTINHQHHNGQFQYSTSSPSSSSSSSSSSVIEEEEIIEEEPENGQPNSQPNNLQSNNNNNNYYYHSTNTANLMPVLPPFPTNEELQLCHNYHNNLVSVYICLLDFFSFFHRVLES